MALTTNTNVMTTSIGAVLDYGTLVAVTRSPGGFTQAATLIEVRSNLNTNTLGIYIEATTGKPRLGVGATPTYLTSTTGLTGSAWYILAAGKDSGNTTARFHWTRIDNGTPSWVHNSSSSSAGNPGSNSKVAIGMTGTGIVWLGPTQVVAYYDRSLSDAEAEQLVGGLSAWMSLNPKMLWVLDMADINTKVSDYTGNGANQTANAMAVSSVSMPGWTYNEDGIIYPKSWPYRQPQTLGLMGAGKA